MSTGIIPTPPSGLINTVITGVKDGSTTLTPTTDYTLSGHQQTNAGTYTDAVTITGTGNYKDSKTASFTIAKKSISGATVSQSGTLTYTGAQQSAAFEVKVGGTTLTPNTDYTLSNHQQTDAGTSYTATITGKGNYTGTVNGPYTIAKATYTGTTTASGTVHSGQTTTNATLTLPSLPDGASYAATGTAGGTTSALISGTPSISGTTLTYSTTSQNGQTSATITINVTGATNYSNYSVVVTITTINKETVNITGLSVADSTYSGSAHSGYTGTASFSGGTPANKTLTVLYTGTANDSTSYSAATPPTKAGSYTVKATLENDDTYSGEWTDTFTINPKALTAAMLAINGPFTYDGTAKTPVLTVTDGGALSNGTDYTATLTPQTNAGTYSISVTGKGNYMGTPSVNFVVNKLALTGAVITLAAGLYTYTGSGIEPGVTSVAVGGVNTQSSDYTVGYANNVNPGTANVTVTATGSGNFSGSASTTFSIGKATPAAPTVTGNATNNGQTYTYTITAPASGAQYKMDSGSWQSSPVFSGITPGVSATHTFYTKLTETATHFESAEGNTGSVSFPRLTQNPPSITYTISGEWDNGGVSVTITSPATGATYSADDSTYNTTNPIVFANNTSSGTIYVKLDATATHEQSAAASVTIDFQKLDQTAPLAFTLTYANVSDTSYTVTIPPTAGAEYSFDGTNWTSDNTKTGCQPGDEVTGYKRMAGTATHNTSSATSAVVTLPLFQVKTPAASPNGGTFTTSQSVTLSCAAADAIIYYTMDGTTPTTGSTLYSGVFTLSATTTVKAIAVKSGMNVSEIMSVTFTKSSGNGGDNGGGDNGGGGNDGGGSSSGTTPTPATPSPSTGTVDVKINGQTVTGTISDDGVLTLTYTADDVKKHTNDTGVYEIEIPKQQENVSVNVPIQALGGNHLNIKTDFGTVQIPNAALQVLREKYGDALRLAIIKGSFKIALLDEKGNEIAHNDPANPFTFTLPYTLGKGEKAQAVVAIGKDGKVIPFAVYKNGSIIFDITETGTYNVIYNKKNFNDVAGHWALDSIDFVAARGIYSGDNGNFMPNGSMTRAMFAMALANLDGADLSVYKTSRFSDVPVSQWYAAAVGWAVDKGIVSGTGGGNFSPNAPITREQMTVMLVKYMNYKGYTVPTGSAADFKDEGSISSWALDAVKAIQKMGIVSGRPGKLFDPQGVATRAEVATIFARFVEHVEGVTATGRKTTANNAMDVNTLLAMLPGKEN